MAEHTIPLASGNTERFNIDNKILGIHVIKILVADVVKEIEY
jgi:hypothetical protein